jgi:hypothetical protein
MNLTDYRVNPNPAKTAFDIDRDALVHTFVMAGLDRTAALTAAGVEARVYQRRVGRRLLG